MSEPSRSSRMKVEELLPGLVLARPVGIAGSTGQTLLEEGLLLDQSHINKLHDWGIDEVYVFLDPGTRHTQLQQLADDGLRLLSDHAKDEALTGLTSSMEILKGGGVISAGELGDISAQLLEVLSLDKQVLVRATHAMRESHFVVRHGLSVAIFALVLSKSVGLTDEEAKLTGQAALLHDMGLSGMPESTFDHVRLLEGKLTLTDTSHIDRSVAMAKQTQRLAPEALEAISFHHEYLDGSGPLGKKGDELSRICRALSLADVFIHLTQPFDRTLRIPESEAVKVIFAHKHLFDENMLRGFLGDFAVYPVGSMVQLSNGVKAVVVNTNKNKPFRPVVKLLSDQNGQAIDKQVIQDLDQREHQLTYIKEALPGEFDFASLL